MGMYDEDIKTLAGSVIEKNYPEAEKSFQRTMSAIALDRLGEFKKQVAQKFFNGVEQKPE